MSRRVFSTIASCHRYYVLDSLAASLYLSATQFHSPSTLVQPPADSIHVNSWQHSPSLWTRGHKVDASKQPDEHQHAKHCWSCDFHVQKGGLVCRACDKIQPVEQGVNFFELFDIPEAFDVDLGLLEKCYKSLQWRIHPDKAAGKTAQEQQFSAQQAAVLNHAYSILKSPLSRANYLLLVKGAATEEEEENIIMDPELLAEVLELREEIEDAEDPQKLKDILTGVQAQESDVVSQLSVAFANEDLQAAKSLVTQLSYISKLIATAVAKLP